MLPGFPFRVPSRAQDVRRLSCGWLEDKMPLCRVVPAMWECFKHLCQRLNSHDIYIYIIGDGHQPNSRSLYTHHKDFLLKVGADPSTFKDP